MYSDFITISSRHGISLGLQSCIWINQKNIWNNFLWTDETDVETFVRNAQQHVWLKLNSTYQHKYFILTVKHGGGGVLIWTWVPCRH